MGWPLNRDGTVDWETAFTNFETGLIPTIEQAKTLDALKSCSVVVISSLFARKNDATNRDTYLAALENIFGAPDAENKIELIRARLVTLLISIKNNRIERAAEYAKLLQRGGGEERRMKADNPLAPLEALKTT